MIHFRAVGMMVLVLLGVFCAREPVWAARAANTDVELILEQAAIKPGGELWAGIRFRPDPHWHVYWRNPGDSGLEPKIKWSLPATLRPGEVYWPYPQRIEVGGLTSYGYEKEVTLLVPVTIGAESAKGEVILKAHVDFLTCKVECEPGSVELEARLAVAEKARQSPKGSRLSIKKALRSLPLEAGVVPIDGRIEKGQLVLKVSLPEVRGRSGVQFFPYSAQLIDHHAAQVWRKGELAVPLSPVAALPDRMVEGIIVAKGPIRQGSDQRSAAVRFELAQPIAGRTVAPPASEMPPLSFWLACLFALAGGALLNLMPCVLPVLSLKILSLVRHGRDRGELFQNGLLYTLGVVLSFIAIAGFMLALRALGTQIGWGFQFQSGAFLLVMIVVLVTFAMNLFGLFEIATPHVYGKDKLSRWGALGTGVLATVLATPCTAPFMGTALGYALTLPTVLALVIFVCIGLGMALPYLFLSMFPEALSFVPKPGPWMNVLKAVFGVVLMATAAWLLWVLDGQRGTCGLRVALITAAAAVTGSWAIGLAQRRSQRWLLLLAFCGISVGLAAGVWSVSRCPTQQAEVKTGVSLWQNFSEVKVSEARAAGKTVLIDFTAKWCLTCQVNDRTVFRHPRVLAALSHPDVVAFQADWTSFSPEITRALAKFGRSSVPLYVVYPPGGEQPEVLSVVISPEMIISALKASK